MKEKLFYLYLFLSIIVLIFTFTGCKSPTEPAAPSGAEPAAPLGASNVIGLAGGTVEVTNPTSPLYGIKVEVPPGALNTDSTISIETTTINPSHNTDSRASSVIFKLESTNTNYLNIPVTVTIPYNESLVDDESYIGLFIYNSSTNSWQSTTTYEIDTINNTISAATRHFSLFQVVSIISASIGNNIDTGFTPDLNGFQIPNVGGSGWCYGMSAYSQWFFENKSPNTLYGFYDDITARDVAAESQLKVTDWVNGLLLSLDGIANFVLNNTYGYLCSALVITGKPQLIVMYDLYPLVGHMVVAYAIHDGKVYIYDNNYPDEELFLTPNYSGGFLNYEDYTTFLLVGAAHFFEDFEDIYDKYFPNLVWEEYFESYSDGSFPSAWTPDGNATSISTNYVDNTVFCEGTKSLRLFGIIGGCWGALAYRPLTVSYPYVIEVAVRNGDESLSGCHPDRACIGIRQGTSWHNPARNFIIFKRDGTIKSGGGGVSLGSYTTLTWYTVRIRYERPFPSEVKLSYWINGTYKGSEVLSAIPDEDQLTNIELTVQEATAWFDAVKVFY